MADIDTPFIKEIFDIPERERKTDVEHHRQAEDLRAGFEVLEGTGFGHAGTLASALSRLKRSSSDNATQPPELCLERIIRDQVPLNWDEQERRYGFT